MNYITAGTVLFGLYQTVRNFKRYQVNTTTRRHKEVIYKAYLTDMGLLWLGLASLRIYVNYWINLK